MPDVTLATSAAPLARRGIARRRLRLVHGAQRALVAASLLGSAVAWSVIMRLADKLWDQPWFVAVPALLVVSAAASFARGLWAIVVVRAALWSGLVCAVVIMLLGENHVSAAGMLGVSACVGLVFLGRFSRAFGGARPLLVALAVLAVSDAAIHGLIAVFVALDNGGRDLPVVAVCSFAALANVVGLAFILRRGIAWPHIVGNAIVIVLVWCDLLDAPAAINVPMVAAASLQIGLALAQRLPRVRAGTRRSAELAVRAAIVLLMAAMIWRAFAELAP